MKAFFDSSVLVPEVYSSLTRMPGRHRISTEQAILFIENLRERLAVVSLDAEEYWQGLKKYADLGIVGGTIYDAMLGYCALKAKAETIYSWTTRHYQQLGPEIVRRLQTP